MAPRAIIGINGTACPEYRTMAELDLADLNAFAAVARQLNRTTRSVTPTEAGTRLLERLVPALGEVSAALDAVNGFRDSPSGTLRLNVPTIVARLILPP